MQARFLKACGTLAETPAEIRKASAKSKFSPSYDGDSEPPKFHSWLPNTSIKKLQLDNQTEQAATPIKLSEEWGKGSGLQEQTPSRLYFLHSLYNDYVCETIDMLLIIY